MFYESNYFGMHFFWWIIWIFFLLWIFATPYDVPYQRSKKESPLNILKARYAKGEISKEEFEETKKTLNIK
ncbi:SHOCT domain-containing protein [Bizionia arctica]|uniref:SHOCT domain-containing protein n=1 Tax=Bizionia arctica TaxID=1495645 RepID=A0A917GKL8_9FLAO|nr:SHOCT domain-containing protein [Bizionia arctica]GGG49382.1 hypothetical protein GCM10010976_20860 [Bizionia arctica]